MIRLPYYIPHRNNLPDMEKVIETLEFHAEFLISKDVNFTYRILIGATESAVLFELTKKKRL